MPGIVVGERSCRKEVVLADNDDESHIRYEPTGETEPIIVFHPYEIGSHAPVDLDEVELTKWIAKKSKELQRARRAAFKRYEEGPRGKAYDKWCEKGEEVARITKQMSKIPPTTMAGVAALLAHWSRIATDRDTDLDLIGTKGFLADISKGLRAAGRQA
jgi:hypothetical protein